MSLLIKGQRSLFRVFEISEGVQLYFRDFVLIPLSFFFAREEKGSYVGLKNIIF